MHAVDMDNLWRAKLEDAERAYRDNHNAETREEYQRLLRLFANLVLRDQLPPPLGIAAVTTWQQEASRRIFANCSILLAHDQNAVMTALGGGSFP
jgi:hypothetical protein